MTKAATKCKTTLQRFYRATL